MERIDTHYQMSERDKENLQRAYDSGRRSMDVLTKLRLAGRPQPEAETRVQAGIDDVKRLAAAFEVELEE